MFFHRRKGHRYVDRGDPSAFDFVTGDFITDGTWRDLDLSSIVPSGAVAVDILTYVKDDVVGSLVQFQKKDNVNGYNLLRVSVFAADITIPHRGIIACNAARFIQYWATNTIFTDLDFVVCGWFTAG